MKGKGSERKKLIKELDKLISEIVINRDKECVICGKCENLTNGHLITRSNYATRWNLFNCNCQCIGCNLKHEYHPEYYTSWFIKNYGIERYDEVCQLSHTVTHYKTSDLLFIKEDLLIYRRLILNEET